MTNLKPRWRIVYSEASTAWGGQERCIMAELKASSEADAKAGCSHRSRVKFSGAQNSPASGRLLVEREHRLEGMLGKLETLYLGRLPA